LNILCRTDKVREGAVGFLDIWKVGFMEKLSRRSGMLQESQEICCC
jgi:hypothetical protein